jgi:hypothetical protein
MKVINNVLFVIVLLSCAACKHRMRLADYVSYINNKENGFKKISQIDGWEFCIQYKPYDYIMLMENKGNFKGYDLEKRKAELMGTAWFNISIKRADNGISPLKYGVASIEEYNCRLNYYLNEASKDIKLVYDKRTLQPISYLFENNYNLSPQETIVVGFYLPEGEYYPEKNMRISFVDRVFKNGIINATYSEETLKNAPNLQY